MSATDLLAVGGWPVLAVWTSAVVRRAPARLVAPVVAPVVAPEASAAPVPRTPAGRAALLLDRRVRRHLERALPQSLRRLGPGLARAAGGVGPERLAALGVLTIVGLVAAPTVTVVALGGGVALVTQHGRRRRRRRAQAMRSAVPDLLDLVRVALGSGCTVSLALTAIASRYSGALAADLRHAARDIEEGRGVSSALEGLLARTGDVLRPMCSALLAGERYGLPTAAMLETLAAEARAGRAHDAAARARRLPVTLLFPLITCTLPAFALLTVVPLLASGLQAVHW